MLVISEIEPARRAIRDAQRRGKTVGLVPTMGALHEGHLSLIEAARERCAAVAVTIFVNPAQFGPSEDLDAYPRPLETDLAVCERTGADIVFTPMTETMYPGDELTTVHVAGITEHLCGAHRPGHFDGVSTVVLKLFNILPADFAFFGEKDYQQLMVVRRMVQDLNLPIQITACPTVREADGLAMSSRNKYLSPDQRQQAGSLFRALHAAVRRIEAGERDPTVIVQDIRKEIAAAGPVTIDYVDVIDAVTLNPLTVIRGTVRICLAVRIGPCRLIDNVGVDASGETG